MICNDVDRLLDDLMDDVLSEDDRRGLESHCAGCPDCAVKLRATREMLLLFSEMAPEVDVPLQVQADWRRAVKAEADSGRVKRFYKLAGGVAAALVVAAGATFALRTAPTTEVRTVAPMIAEEAAPVRNAMVQADGAVEEADAEESIGTAVALAAPMHEIGMTVEDIDKTCAYMSDLVSEYEGGMDEQRFEEDGKACANLYIDLPAENADEFLNAASHYDVDGDMGTLTLDEAEGGRVSVLLVLKEG